MALGFPQPGIWWEVQTTPVLVQDRYRIVRRLLSLRAVCFYNRLRTSLRQQGHVSPRRGFLTSAAGTPPHMGVKMSLLVLHCLEICLYIVEALSTFWSPVED